MTSTAPFKLLFLGAGPEDMPRIRQDREYKKIRQRLARSRHGDRVIVADEQAVSASELSEHLLEHNPHIVHIKHSRVRRQCRPAAADTTRERPGLPAQHLLDDFGIELFE